MNEHCDTARPPALPLAFTEPGKPWATSLFILQGVLLAFGPGVLAWHIAGQAPSMLGILALPLAFVSGFGYYVMGSAAHEGFHFTLARSKLLSAALGIFFSSAIIGFFGLGFYLVHSRHHRHTNTPEDPDLQLFTRFPSTWRRMLVLRLVNNRVYMRIVASLLLRGALPDGTPGVFSPRLLRCFAGANVLAQLLWLAFYVGLFTVDPWLGLCVVLIPHMATAVISAAIVFVQHADTGVTLADNARTHSSIWATLLMGGTNFHLEHHLYPRVPCWRLRRVHRWLGATEWAARHPPLVEGRFWRGLMLCRGRHPYGPRTQT